MDSYIDLYIYLYNKLEKLNVQAGKRDKILLEHVQRICEAHGSAGLLASLRW